MGELNVVMRVVVSVVVGRWGIVARVIVGKRGVVVSVIVEGEVFIVGG